MNKNEPIEAAGSRDAEESCNRLREHPGAISCMVQISAALMNGDLSTEELKLVRDETAFLINSFLKTQGVEP